MSIEKLYNMCVEAGYNGSLDEFVCELESIVLKENKQIEKVSEEDIMKVSGGANLGQKVSAGALSALMLGTSTGFAETLKSNQSKNEVITNTQKLPKQKEYIVNKHDKKNLKNILFKVFGIGTVVGLSLLALAAIYKIKTAEKFEDAFDEFNKAIEGFGKNSNEEIIKICEEFKKRLLKELNTRKIDISNWNLVDLKGKTDKKAVKIVLEHIIAGLNTLNGNLDENKDAHIKGAVGECILKLNLYLDTVKQEINKEHEEHQKKEDKKIKREEESNEQENWYNYDKETNTITVEDKKEKPTEITNEMVQKMAKKYSLSEENKINLVLKNCVVRKEAFAEFKFIDNLTIDQGAVVNEGGFLDATITDLTINDDAKVEKNGFWGATITDLAINDGATVEGCGFHYATITDLTINNGVTVEENRFLDAIIMDLTINDGATVERNGFIYTTITNLTIKDGATVEENGFWKAKITDLTINKGATLKQYGFSGAEIINLTINDGTTVEENGFSNATIKKLTINDGTTVEKNGFNNATITGLTIDQGATVKQYGFWDAKITNLTINGGATVEENGFRQATITNLTINDGAVVNSWRFSGATITNLTINDGVTVERDGFRRATITDLTINKGATVEENGFSRATITDLTINNGATVEENGFSRATITSTAKYDSGQGISNNILKNWGFEQQQN